MDSFDSEKSPYDTTEAVLNRDKPFRPQHFDYMTYKDRLYTFQSWPKESSHRPEALAEMGFCFNQRGDDIFCFCCDCEISDLQPGEDLWIRHAIIAPECVYLQNQKGKEFIEETRTKVLVNKNQHTTDNNIENQQPEPNVKIIFASPIDCKICFTRNVRILFLPCSHLASCAQCSVYLTKCFVCKETIEYMVRVNLPKDIDNE